MLTRPHNIRAGRPLRAVEELELKWINLAMPGETELRILSAIVEFALEGSVKHAEFLFNRKYGLPTARITQQTESRIRVVYDDGPGPGYADNDDNSDNDGDQADNGILNDVDNHEE